MKRFLILMIILLVTETILSQELKENTKAKYESWVLLQLVPSPTMYQDANNDNARILFGFKWQITPLNISFNPNKYVSPFQFFMINPVRRFTGSAEIFIQPELALASFKYSDLSIFGVSTGPRIIIPLSEKGENLSFSIAGKFTYRKNFDDGKDYYPGVEAGLYIFGGFLGLQYTQNFNTKTNYNFNIYIKYF
jgi:hypothetical protein